MNTFRVSANSVGLPWDDQSVKQPIYDKWEALAQELNHNVTGNENSMLGSTF